ncbi:hypothetical protein GCM10008910_24750 [Faecalicatena orotica]|uniref:Uncharacterized protein n=1 Tax=Faecalicatena orotica TaxID=1544 RepID=A0A2Y9BIL5_9FIRM|nr:hypothetical protein [Faecalicatena orotica]PWJ28283.1 hypothetical protein A8806_109163 [Faecalicatena orotica]SSA56738.1 hypothetical protein SAMN05216536_109163 [Faecalicatena orotica]
MKKTKTVLSGKQLLCKGAAVLSGAALLAGWILTGNTGIASEDKKIYEEAASLQPVVDEIGFQDFKLEDYPVAMYDGKHDYVFYNGEIEKREPVLETFAGTAYPVGDHFEVIIPTMKRFESLLSLAGGVEGMASGSGYGEEEQTATIWHEAFHAWQLSSHQIMGERMTPEDFTEDMETASGQAGETEEDFFKKEVDQKKDVKKELEQEMRLLKKIVTGSAMEKGKIDEVRNAVLEYRKLEDGRREKMTQEAADAERRCELTEGTAYYVEGIVLKAEKGSDKGGQTYKERYLETLDKYEDGRGKYYRIGMAKCLILDQLSPDWKETMDFSKSLDEMLDEAVSAVK